MCDTMVIVNPGRVLFAKNSDRNPNEAQFLDWQPSREHPRGARVRCSWVEIPQSPRTLAVLLSRPFWMWGAEIGANERDVVVGNEAVFTKQPYARTGLTGMDLVRLALERGETARDACDVIVALLAEHGQGGGCGHESKRFTYHNSFLIADPREAYVLETAGREWASERVKGARSISNGLTIPEFAKRHSAMIRTRVSGCRFRRARTQSLAERATSPGDLFAILRDHGTDHGLPAYSWINGGLSVPCVHAGGLIAASQTTASWVADLQAGNSQHWVTATSAPCTGLFKPVRVNEPLDLGPSPTDRADERSLWWRHERFSRRVLANPGELFPLFQHDRDAIEDKWLASRPASGEAFAQGDVLLADWANRLPSSRIKDVRPIWVRVYWARRNRWAGL